MTEMIWWVILPGGSGCIMVAWMLGQILGDD